MASFKAELERAKRSGSGRKPDQGPGDLVKADREAGRNIQRDDSTWTVATPDEFRAGMSETAKRGSGRGKKRANDEEKLKQELSFLLGGRRKRYATDVQSGEDPSGKASREKQGRQMETLERRGLDPSGAYRTRPAGHGGRTLSEQFTEPEDETMATNAEERALLRERDRLDPYGKPTRKMQLQDRARQAIIDEYSRRRRG